MSRTRSAFASIPTLEHCNLDHDADFPPLYFTALEWRSELPRTYPHRHSYFHLFWVTQGAGRHMIDFCDHPVQDRSIFIVAPGQIHYWSVAPGTQGCLFNFNAEIFDGSSAGAAAHDEQLRLRLQVNPAFYPDAAQAQAVSQLVDLIAAEYRQPGRGSTEIVTHLFQVLLLRILRIEQPSTVEPTSASTGLSQRFALEVERRFLQSSAIADYANALCVSERTLAEATKRATGKTPKELILDRLLLEAKRLLLHSTKAVAEIAYHLNFEDPAYFGRFFRRRTGMAPGEFKRVTRDTGSAPLPASLAAQKCHSTADSS
ncbi:MAG: helix-turn-helix domain-containing protein [Pseudomonadota bacterium]|nr:helix-turn-helix domain-containing protein [Pseudomonadota bacterium]